jgi:hypothetical protein
LDVGPGQIYSTNGINDYIAINNAISAAESGDVVYLHSGTYFLSIPINILNKNSITFKGEGSKNTVIEASSYDAFLGSNHGDGTRSLIQLKNASDVTISGFTLKGALPQIEPDDQSQNGILVLDSIGLKFQDIYFTQLSNNGIRAYGAHTYETKTTSVSNCIFNTTNHDCIGLWDEENWHIYNCNMTVRSNSGINLRNSSYIEINDNTFHSSKEYFGNGGIQLGENLANITIHHNAFQDMVCSRFTGKGIYEDEDASGRIKVNNNVFYNCPGGNIVTNHVAVQESNNVYTTKVFDWTSQGYGYNPEKASSPTETNNWLLNILFEIKEIIKKIIGFLS